MTWSSTVLGLAPLAWWRQGDASGTTMTDSSGNARNGTYVGSPTLGSPSLIPSDTTNTACTYAGGSHGEIAYGSWMDVASGGVLVNFKLTALGSYQNIVDRDNGSTRLFQFRVSNTNQLQGVVWVSGSGLVSVMGSTTLTTGVDYQAGMIVNGTNVILTLNGVQDGIGAATGTWNTGALGIWIGRDQEGANFYFQNGVIDEVLYFGPGITVSNFLSLYNASQAPPATAPVITGDPLNAAALIRWGAVAAATSYDVTDGTTTNNVASPGTSYIWSGLTNGVAKTFTVTAKNATGSGPTSSSVTVTPSATSPIILFDSFTRSVTPPGNPDYGPAPSVQTNTSATGASMGATAVDAFQIWDVTATDQLQIDLVLGAVSTGELDIITSYTDATHYEFFSFNYNSAIQGSYYTDVAGTFTQVLGENVKVYDVTQALLLRNLAAGDKVTVIVDAGTIRLLYNGVPRIAYPWAWRVSTSKVGVRFTAATGWTVDSITVSNLVSDTVAGYVYKGRATKTLDTGSVA